VSFGNQLEAQALSLAGSSRFRDLLPVESGQGQIRRMFRITNVRGTGREPRGDPFAAQSISLLARFFVSHGSARS